METIQLDFECTHETGRGTMTCSWLDGIVKMVEHFSAKKTGVYVDNELKCTYDDLSVEQFMKLQVECQKVADSLEGKEIVL